MKAAWQELVRSMVIDPRREAMQAQADIPAPGPRMPDNPSLAPDMPDAIKPVRPAYKPEEGPPEGRSEWWSMLRALLYGAAVIALIGGLLFLWRA